MNGMSPEIDEDVTGTSDGRDRSLVEQHEWSQREGRVRQGGELSLHKRDGGYELIRSLPWEAGDQVQVDTIPASATSRQIRAIPSRSSPGVSLSMSLSTRGTTDSMPNRISVQPTLAMALNNSGVKVRSSFDRQAHSIGTARSLSASHRRVRRPARAPHQRRWRGGTRRPPTFKPLDRDRDVGQRRRPIPQALGLDAERAAIPVAATATEAESGRGRRRERLGRRWGAGGR